MLIRDTPAVVALRQARHELVRALKGRCYNCRHCVVVEALGEDDAWCRCEQDRWRKGRRKRMNVLEDQAAIECGEYRDSRDRGWNDEG